MADHRARPGQDGNEVVREPAARSAAAAPLAMSRRATASPSLKPSERQTFVAPVFPLPTVRMSTPPIHSGSQ